MQTLFPIIRRVRRPLLVQDAPPVLVGNVEPVKVDAALAVNEQPVANTEPTERKAESNDADTLY